MALIVVGISEEGYREILGMRIALRETAESWRELLGELKDRGVWGVELATSDANEGLEAVLRETFLGCMAGTANPTSAATCSITRPQITRIRCMVCSIRFLSLAPSGRLRAVLRRSLVNLRRRLLKPSKSSRKVSSTPPARGLAGEVPQAVSDHQHAGVADSEDSTPGESDPNRPKLKPSMAPHRRSVDHKT